MPTYVYETIPADGGKPTTYELQQRMSEDALTEHPITGEAIRRIPAGGTGVTGFAEPACGTDCGIPGSGTGGGCCPFSE